MAAPTPPSSVRTKHDSLDAAAGRTASRSAVVRSASAGDHQRCPPVRRDPAAVVNPLGASDRYAGLSFDRIIVVTKHALHFLDIPQFLALPLSERVQALAEGRVRFLKGDDEVEVRQALDDLRRGLAPT